MLSITLFVDDDATASGNGLAWATAYDDLQSALTQAATLNTDGNTANDVDQIWIAEGTYHPTTQLEPGDARSASFSLVDGVTLYGGFTGTETTLAERDLLSHLTTLSGDLGVVNANFDNAYTVVYSDSDITTAIDGLSIVDGNANITVISVDHHERLNGGGIYNTYGHLTVTNCTVSDNSAGCGGGIYNKGDLTITNSTISDNSTNSGYGGGICNYLGDLAIINSTVSRNSVSYGGGDCDDGGGIWNVGDFTLTNSSIVDNSASRNGGGIHTSEGDLIITNSTVSGNSANCDGGGIFSDSANLVLSNSILWNNTGGDSLDRLGSFSGSQNLIGIDPQFVDPANGDYRLQATSPAINFGDNSLAVDMHGNPLSLDAGGNDRIYDSAVDCGPHEFQSAIANGRETPSLTVSSTSDVFDLYDNRITLREAIYYTNVDSLGTMVNFDATLDGATITLLGTSLFIEKTITIDASSLTSLTVDADKQSQVFTVIACNEDEVTLNSLTITGGSAYIGGGIHNSGNLSLTNSTLSGNAASSFGGGIYNGGNLMVANSIITGNSAGTGGGVSNWGNLTITNSTLSDNSASDGGGVSNSKTMELINSRLSYNSAIYGGGIQNWENLTLTNSMILDNSAHCSGGGIYIWKGHLTITNSTISANSAKINGGGIYSYSGTVALNNSILWENDGSEFDGKGNFSGSQNLIGIDPQFVDPVNGDYRLQATSPAISFGNNSLAVSANNDPLMQDAAGNVRIYGETVDCGPMEFQGMIAPGRETPSLTVTTSSNSFDLYDNQTTLREAIYHVGSGMLGTAITFDAALDGSTITLFGTSIFVGKKITIDASSLTSLTIDADNQSRVFTVVASDGEEVILRGLTITGGLACQGGGIYSSSKLTLINSTLSNCSVSGSYSNGGGIYNLGDLTITNSMLSGNSAGSYYSQGGGIYNLGDLVITGSAFSDNLASYGAGIDSSGLLVIKDSAFIDNSASFSGGGINNSGTLSITNSKLLYNFANHGGGISSGNNLAITQCTVSDNSASEYGGGIYSSGTVMLNNTIVAGNTNTSGPDIYSTNGTLSGSHNLIGNGFGQTLLVNGIDGNLVGTSESPIDPRFIDPDGGDYRLQAGSPAVNAGDNTLAVDQDGTPLEVDLARHLRIQDGTVDIGAYEFGMIDWGTVRLKVRNRSGLEELEWMDEWTGCWVEIWGHGNAVTGIGSFDVELGFRSGCFMPDMTKVVPGVAVDGGTLGVTLDEAEGKLRVTGSTLGDNVGQGTEVFLAKVYFKPTPGESVLERDTDGKHLKPVTDAGFQVTEAELTQAGTSAVCMATIEQHAAVPLWPVMYDLNGDSVINLRDVSQFVAVFQWTTDENAPPMTWASDFDRSGKVDLKDLSEMLARFKWRKGDSNSVSYPDYFPYDEAATSAAAPESLSYTDAALAKSTWSETDITSIAKDLTPVSVKKSTATSDELFALEIDPYANLQ